MPYNDDYVKKTILWFIHKYDVIFIEDYRIGLKPFLYRNLFHTGPVQFCTKKTPIAN